MTDLIFCLFGFHKWIGVKVRWRTPDNPQGSPYHFCERCGKVEISLIPTEIRKSLP